MIPGTVNGEKELPPMPPACRGGGKPATPTLDSHGWLHPAWGRPPGRRPPDHRHSCDGQHIQFRAPHLTSDLQVKGGCDMVADWIVIYAVLFVLAAAVVGRVPADT